MVFEGLLRKSGNFETVGAPPGSEVAVLLSTVLENEWILGKVLHFYYDTGEMFKTLSCSSTLRQLTLIMRVPVNDIEYASSPSNKNMHMLCVNVCSHIGFYDIADMDDASKRYYLSESKVIVLSSDIEEMKRLSRGEEVLAVYPDTTSFYPATVAGGLKKVAGTHTVSVQVMIEPVNFFYIHLFVCDCLFVRMYSHSLSTNHPTVSG